MKVKLFSGNVCLCLCRSLSLHRYLSPPLSSAVPCFILYFHEFNIFHPSSVLYTYYICTYNYIYIYIYRIRATEDPVLGDGWPRVSLIPVNPINRARPYFTVFLCSTNLSHHILFAPKYHPCHHSYFPIPPHTHTPLHNTFIPTTTFTHTPLPRKSLWNFLICPISSFELHDYPISDFEIHHFGWL